MDNIKLKSASHVVTFDITDSPVYSKKEAHIPFRITMATVLIDGDGHFERMVVDGERVKGAHGDRLLRYVSETYTNEDYAGFDDFLRDIVAEAYIVSARHFGGSNL